MKKRTKRQLARMHVWTHRRFHNATEPRFWPYWLGVRTKIEDLIVQEERIASRTVSLDEWFQIWAADKAARDLGFKMTWKKTEVGLEIGMGKENGNQTALSTQRRRDRG